MITKQEGIEMGKKLSQTILKTMNVMSNVEGSNYQAFEVSVAIKVLEEIQKYNNTEAVENAKQDLQEFLENL